MGIIDDERTVTLFLQTFSVFCCSFSPVHVSLPRAARLHLSFNITLDFACGEQVQDKETLTFRAFFALRVRMKVKLLRAKYLRIARF